MGRSERRYGYCESQGGYQVPFEVYSLLVLLARQSAQSEGSGHEFQQGGQMGSTGYLGREDRNCSSDQHVWYAR